MREILAGHEGLVTVAVSSLTQHLELAYNILIYNTTYLILDAN